MSYEWNLGYPLDHTEIGDVPGEIRKLKTSAKTQLDREHETPVDGDSAGTEHSSGSAVSYEGTSTPTNRPDGITALADNAIDRGRLWLDTNYDPPRLKRWSGSAWVVVGSSGFVFSGATVFADQLTVGDTWQDLDLSSIVGLKRALCFFEMRASSAVYYALKPKGFGGAFVDHIGSAGRGVAEHYAGGLAYSYLMCSTDSSGILQHGASNISTTITLKLFGYIPAV